MAKRSPSNEIAYNPLDMTLAQSVVKGTNVSHRARFSSDERIGERVDHHATLGLPSASNRHVLDMPSHSDQIAPLKATSIRSLTREKRVLLTPVEEREIERLVGRIGEQLETSLKLSHLLRACMTVLCHAEAELLRSAAEFRPLSRPANGSAVALAQFEQALTTLLSKALRDAPPIR